MEQFTHSKELLSENFLHFSAISETTAKVIGDSIEELESFQHFTQKGTYVKGGNAAKRVWVDKTFIPITISHQCIDCLHCVVACPHSSIQYEVNDKAVNPLLEKAKKLVSMIPGFHLSEESGKYEVSKGKTSYQHCKGCFVCASACPTGAIHFVEQNLVDSSKFGGKKIDAKEVLEIYEPPSIQSLDFIKDIHRRAQDVLRKGADSQQSFVIQKINNGSEILAGFIEQAKFDTVSMFPITPNGKLIAAVEELARKEGPDGHKMEFRSTLSEEAGYAFLTGVAAKGDRALICQGSQSLAQIYEFLNINPGLHLPIFMLELTRALSPGTSIKPDHTTTMRTSDTGEIVLFGRSLQDNYDKALLLLKLMETDGVWIPGRLVVKGFIETHTFTTQRQKPFEELPQEKINEFIGRRTNPYIFSDYENRALGVLDFDARYSEEKFAIDQTLMMAGLKFDEVSESLSKFTGRTPIQKVSRYPQKDKIDLCIVSLNDPDVNTVEYVSDELRKQGIRCGVLSINLYRPFPADEIRNALEGVKAVAVLEFDNWSGRSGGGVLAQEVRSAMYSMSTRVPVIAVQVGLGGRAVTVSYIVTLYRMLEDLSHNEVSKTHRWLEEYAPDNAFPLGTRGMSLPVTSQDFDIPFLQEGVAYMTVVGRGGQGLMLLNSMFIGAMSLEGKFCSAMSVYGALQRGGGISLSIKISDEKIKDESDIVIADTIVAFEGDKSLEAMLPQLRTGGTLLLAGERETADCFKALRPDAKVFAIPANILAQEIHGRSDRINLIMLGAMLRLSGVKTANRCLALLQKMLDVPEIAKTANLLSKEECRLAVLSGFISCDDIFQGKPSKLEHDEEGEMQYCDKQKTQFLDDMLPVGLRDNLDHPQKLNSLKDRYALKKKMYQLMFSFHPMVNQIQSMFIHLRGDSPLSAGDMACPGCGQVNIFRTVFNYIEFLQKDRGKIYVSEQDGCGTVFTSMDRTSTWNIPYVRIAFETAHGVAAGLSKHSRQSDDIVVSITGDGGFMQGIRSVEDSLHQQDPIFHIIVVNQTLGNTGGQATATTMIGEHTKEGHEASREPVNLLKYAEKYKVAAAQASTVHLWDLYDKVRKGHDIVTKQKKPFMLMLYFSCLEQGMNLAYSLTAQKRALDGHFINLYSVDFKPVKNWQGKTLYLKKKLTIDWFPMSYGKKSWVKSLKSYFGLQKISKHIVEDEEKLDEVYWLLRGRWENLKHEMGFVRYYGSFMKSFFSISRFTMNRLIKKDVPDQAK
ncbi:MAG: 2-oxoacid:acceptor oxidoreductase family protein [Lentisphaerales bacterium]|nr:2-oxoacid:acceptor oxidoreductase family protein [Lentisphaerales bacterium]